ncbi:hypothetical protein [Brachybacterium sp. J153]|uniref:hypothetical protein n=1 Tax=Brachybacterium sp. J153 TaxID=3116488 RepID=UPI002E788FBD|nr:hypothetical protein [Brachybacterium sp. J153]MEE1617310.1 hypothetical protein [Brachybacterium sp. J153]
MSFSTDNIITAIGTHRERVALIAEHDGTVPAAYRKAEQRWDAWIEATNDQPLTELTDAYADGADETTLATLRAAALIAEVATPVQLATVRNSVAPAAHAALRAAYAPQAVKNYAKIAAQYDSAAAEFTRLAQIIDPETDAKHLVSADEDTRRAWLEAELITGKLDTLATVLADAALLAGTNTNGDPALIGLLTDPKSAHRRRVWEAWNSNGRCGKWSALLALDVDLRAADLDEHRPYREPRPLEVQHIRGNFGVRSVTVDPEDDDPTSSVDLRDGEQLVTLI